MKQIYEERGEREREKQRALRIEKKLYEWLLNYENSRGAGARDFLRKWGSSSDKEAQGNPQQDQLDGGERRYFIRNAID